MIWTASIFKSSIFRNKDSLFWSALLFRINRLKYFSKVRIQSISTSSIIQLHELGQTVVENLPYAQRALSIQLLLYFHSSGMIIWTGALLYSRLLFIWFWFSSGCDRRCKVKTACNLLAQYCFCWVTWNQGWRMGCCAIGDSATGRPLIICIRWFTGRSCSSLSVMVVFRLPGADDAYVLKESVGWTSLALRNWWIWRAHAKLLPTKRDNARLKIGRPHHGPPDWLQPGVEIFRWCDSISICPARSLFSAACWNVFRPCTTISNKSISRQTALP